MIITRRLAHKKNKLIEKVIYKNDLIESKCNVCNKDQYEYMYLKDKKNKDIVIITNKNDNIMIIHTDNNEDKDPIKLDNGKKIYFLDNLKELYQDYKLSNKNKVNKIESNIIKKIEYDHKGRISKEVNNITNEEIIYTYEDIVNF